MPLRIVLDVRRIRDFGIGTYIRNLVRALGEIDSQNTYILTGKPDNVHEFAGLPDNFQTAVYDHADNELIDNFAFPHFLKNYSADVVHLPLNQVPLFMPKPYVVTIHDMSSFLFGNRGGFRENLRLEKFRRGLLRADRVIAVSGATRRDIQNVLGVPADRIRLVYSAPDPKFLNANILRFSQTGEADLDAQEHERLRERYQIPYPFLLYAGRIRPHKNIPRLIEAFAVLRGRLENHPLYKDLRLVIIGDEIFSHPGVRRTVAQTRVENAVRFLGFVPFETLKFFYSAAAGFVFPSLYEGFGLPPLEAMASGTPVLTSNIPALAEAVSDAAVLVNPENVFELARGMEDLLLDNSLRARLITRGFERVRQFDWRRTAEQVSAVYQEIADHKKK